MPHEDERFAQTANGACIGDGRTSSGVPSDGDVQNGVVGEEDRV